MVDYNLAIIPGDGVGPEVVAEGRKVLDALAAQEAGLLKFGRLDNYLKMSPRVKRGV